MSTLCDLHTRAQAGDADAQYALGMFYYNQRPHTHSPSSAISQHGFYWLKKAALQNHRDACFSLGSLYYQNNQPRKSVYMFYRAARQGCTQSITNMGIAYLDGIGGVEKDYALALSFFRIAVRQNSACAQNCLGHMYEFGLGVEVNYTKALEMYQLSATSGYASAQNDLGRFYQNGYGNVVPVDWDEAEDWYTLAANQNYAPAQNNLGFLYLVMAGAMDDPGDEMHHWNPDSYYSTPQEFELKSGVRSEMWLHDEKDIEFGHTEVTPTPTYSFQSPSYQSSSSPIPMVMENTGADEKNEKKKAYVQKAIHLLHCAAQQQNIHSLYNLGLFYFRGVGVEQDTYRGIEYMKKAASMGYERAIMFMDVMVQKGIVKRQ